MVKGELRSHQGISIPPVCQSPPVPPMGGNHMTQKGQVMTPHQIEQGEGKYKEWICVSTVPGQAQGGTHLPPAIKNTVRLPDVCGVLTIIIKQIYSMHGMLSWLIFSLN